jgi:hypothetical protein
MYVFTYVRTDVRACECACVRARVCVCVQLLSIILYLPHHYAHISPQQSVLAIDSYYPLTAHSNITVLFW